MSEAIFEFFEQIAEELDGKKQTFFGLDKLEEPSGNPTALMLNLKSDLGVTTDAEIIPAAIEKIHAHFLEKAGIVPFLYDHADGRIYDTNDDFLKFIRNCRELRSLGARAQEFELAVLERLSSRLQGTVHRVGFPREVLKKRDEFNSHLRVNFGFKNPVALGNEKDGGFDLLWQLPLGTPPFVPVVSIQCKNGSYSTPQANHSVAASSTSLNQHSHLHKEAHVNCVVFNDYIEPVSLYPKGSPYVPIGLSDLFKVPPAVGVPSVRI
jgi:hypothetical protein